MNRHFNSFIWKISRIFEAYFTDTHGEIEETLDILQIYHLAEKSSFKDSGAKKIFEKSWNDVVTYMG